MIPAVKYTIDLMVSKRQLIKDYYMNCVRLLNYFAIEKIETEITT